MIRNIVFFIQNISRPAGSERVTSLIANNLDQKGYNIQIVSICGDNTCFYPLNSKIKINTLIENNDFDKKKSKIVKELEYIGYKFNYKGTHYLVDTIMLMHMHQHSMIDNLQTHIYPIIAQKYNKTVYNIKSSINKATECMYYECDVNKLENYFKFNYDTKPTVKQVVFAVINKI